MQEEKQMERRKKIAVELSDLVVYCRPVPFNEDSEHHFFSLQDLYSRIDMRQNCFEFFHLQKLGRSAPVTGTCPPSLRQRQRSLRLEVEGSVSCSTTAASCLEFTPEGRDWTLQTTTHFLCGSAAPSWWL